MAARSLCDTLDFLTPQLTLAVPWCLHLKLSKDVPALLDLMLSALPKKPEQLKLRGWQQPQYFQDMHNLH